MANIINNVFLSMVEDGYTEQSREIPFAWLRSEMKDPADYNIEEEDVIKSDLTAEQFLA